MSRRQLLVAVLWLIPAVLCAVSPLLRSTLPAAWLDHRISDSYFRLRGTRSDSSKFSIIGIDDATYDNAFVSSSYWGWYHADVIRKLASTGAKAIALDLFSPKRPADPLLGSSEELEARALEQAGYEAMGAAIAESRFLYGCPVLLPVYVRQGQMQLPRAELIDAAGGGHETLGFINLFADEAGDSVVREFGLVLHSRDASDPVLPSLPYLAASFAETGALEQPLEESVNQPSVIINYIGPGGSVAQLSYLDILSAAENNLASLSAQWKNRVVFIGDWNQPTDSYVTPYSDVLGMRRMSGVEILVNTADTLFVKRPLREAGTAVFVLAVLFLLALSTLFITRLRSAASVPLELLLGVIVYFSGALLFVQDSVLPAGALLISLAVNSAAVRLAQYGLVDRERRRVAGYFSRYVNPDALRKIVEERIESLLRGERHNIAVLFADIRGFTTLSEKIAPDEIIGFLTQYHDKMADVIAKHGGWVDKFIGDGTMAIFGYPAGTENAADRALLSAQEMVGTAAAMERPDGVGGLRIGVGLHFGPVVVGNVGSKTKLDFTAIGDTVNTASRIEECCKQFQVQILASKDFTEKLAGDAGIAATPLGAVEIRGRDNVELYAFNLKDSS